MLECCGGAVQGIGARAAYVRFFLKVLASSHSNGLRYELMNAAHGHASRIANFKCCKNHAHAAP